MIQLIRQHRSSKAARRIRILGDVVEVVLTRGMVAYADICDYEIISPYTWSAMLTRGIAYALTNPSVLMHRLILNPPSGMVVDHIDGNGLNNRRENLRICTTRQNSMNRAKRKLSKTSKFKGVSESGSLFRVYIKVNYRATYVGTYKSEVEAALAYNVAALRHFGEFAKLNIIDGADVAQESNETKGEPCPLT